MSRFPRIVLAAFACACGATGLTTAGSKIVPVGAAPSRTCETLGQVVGHGGGWVRGGFTTNEDLAISALNDANNKAAQIGATHLQVNPPQFAASGQGTTTSAVVVGVAYKCAAAPEPPREARIDAK